MLKEHNMKYSYYEFSKTMIQIPFYGFNRNSANNNFENPGIRPLILRINNIKLILKERI